MECCLSSKTQPISETVFIRAVGRRVLATRPPTCSNVLLGFSCASCNRVPPRFGPQGAVWGNQTCFPRLAPAPIFLTALHQPSLVVPRPKSNSQPLAQPPGGRFRHDSGP